MDDLAQKLKNTLVDFLLSAGMHDAANLLEPAQLHILYYGFDPNGISIELPSREMVAVQTNSDVREQIENSLKLISSGHLIGNNGEIVDPMDVNISFRFRLLDDEEIWRARIREHRKNEKNDGRYLS